DSQWTGSYTGTLTAVMSFQAQHHIAFAVKPVGWPVVIAVIIIVNRMETCIAVHIILVYRQLVSSRSRYIFFEGNTGAYDYICCSQAGLVYHWQRTVFIISFTARTHAYPEATGKLEQPVAVTVVRIRPCNYMCVGSQYITQVSNI